MHSGRLNLANAWFHIEHVMLKYLINHAGVVVAKEVTNTL